MISAQSISKYYGEQKALSEVSFEAKPGEIVGLLGPNGAGKSTLIKILNGYIEADAGEVKICGKKMQVNSPQMQNLIGYLPEHNPLYTEMYVKEYLSYVAGIYNVDVVIGDLIDRVGLTQEQHKKIKQLSKGYRQRVGLAQALIPDPQVLILDEPTTGLDPNQIVEVRTLIKEIAQEKTVLLSTHIMQEVASICDRVLIINKGQVVANASVDELLHASRSGQEIEIELLQDVDEKDLLSVTNKISKLSSLGERKYILSIDSEEDVRPQLAEGLAAKGWTVLMMKRQESNLESIFAQLTKE